MMIYPVLCFCLLWFEVSLFGLEIFELLIRDVSIVFTSVEFVRQRQIENSCRIAVHPFALHFIQLHNHKVIFECR